MNKRSLRSVDLKQSLISRYENKANFLETKPLVIIADADSIVAQAYTEDLNHVVTLKLVQKLEKQSCHILFPSTAITEAVTTLQRKFSNPYLAKRTLELFTDSDIAIEQVDGEVIREAAQLFDPSASKQNTLFDCIVVVLAKRHNADAILSFDGWYPKLGFKLASQLNLKS